MLEWLGGTHEERARRWARFSADPDDRPAVARLLTSEPAAATRIAALVRAGLARIVAPDAPPAPAPRMPSIPPSAPSRHTPPLGSAAPRSSLPPRKKPSMQLDPGLVPVFDDEPELDPDLPPLPDGEAQLDDPLDALERDIAVLEQQNASGEVRAAAWRAFGEAWEQRFGSVEEAARAYREAAAAAPDDREILALASDRCAALGQADLAVAYARAMVNAAPEGAER
ncbi:MAG TPA: hypothetical protein DEF51_09090, partial [Myxococcales bacterium]|nr:hypothetical protein [Myxococcales bacterium]